MKYDQTILQNYLNIAKEIFEPFKRELPNWSIWWGTKTGKFGNCLHSEKTIFLCKQTNYKRNIDDFKNTVLHEIAHALVGPGHKHNDIWREKFLSIGGKLRLIHMEDKFCKITELDKHKIVEDFPNPQFKICIDSKGIKYKLHIILPKDKIVVSKLNKTQALYFTGKDIDVCILSLNWLPKHKIVGVIKNFYSQDTELSKFTGFIQSVNLGSGTEAFLTSNVMNAVNILTDLGFEFDLKKSAEQSIKNKWEFILKEIGLANVFVHIYNENIEVNFADFPASGFNKNPNTITILNNIEYFKQGVIEKIRKNLLNFKL